MCERGLVWRRGQLVSIVRNRLQWEVGLRKESLWEATGRGSCPPSTTRGTKGEERCSSICVHELPRACGGPMCCAPRYPRQVLLSKLQTGDSASKKGAEELSGQTWGLFAPSAQPQQPQQHEMRGRLPVPSALFLSFFIMHLVISSHLRLRCWNSLPWSFQAVSEATGDPRLAGSRACLLLPPSGGIMSRCPSLLTAPGQPGTGVKESSRLCLCAWWEGLRKWKCFPKDTNTSFLSELGFVAEKEF